LSWFDIIKEPLISVPKSIVSMKKPKKVETKEDCKERLKAFIEKVRSLTAERGVREHGFANFDKIPEEAACKALELLRKEANNKDYIDGGVTYRGRFPEVREKHGNLPRLDDYEDWEISVLFAKFDMADRSEDRNMNKGLLFIEFHSHNKIQDVFQGYEFNVHFDMEIPGLDNYDKVKAVIP